MKKFIFIATTFLFVFIIYYLNIDNKVYYVAMGDQISYGINNFKTVNNSYANNISKNYTHRLKNYVNISSLNDYRIMDLYNDIQNNKKINYKNKEYTFQNLLIKANIITISIGINDLLYQKNTLVFNKYEYVDELLNDINRLFIIIRKYNKDNIYMLGYYNIIGNNQIIDYTNEKLKKICELNRIKFIDISNLNNYILKGIYPTNDGYTYITHQITTFTK